jgi:hypothetical protein
MKGAHLVSHARSSLWRGSLVIAAALLLFAQSFSDAGRTQGPLLRDWENFDFAKQAIQPAQIKRLSLEDLKLLRGLVFGRHGRIFKDPEIRNYLRERPWYRPDPEFRNSSLNETERRNLDLIRESEAKLHSQIEPGDMRFYQNGVITQRQLGEHTGAEWRILRAEVEALHGRRFDDEPWLQEYFEERYWYRPDDKYDPKQLTAVERRNIATIDAARKAQRQVALSPGDMELFQKTAITEEMLSGLGLYELRILRNEVYARRGRQFRTEWISQYFYSQPWYEPLDDPRREPELSAIEKRNVETIVKYENRLKEELSTRPISQSLLDGLFLEDARKLRHEIYARHGKVFKDKWLQKYFASFSWYKPDPQFKESSLSPIEKKNVALILAYEQKATSVMDAIEG